MNYNIVVSMSGSIHFLVYYHGWIWFLAPEVGMVEEHQGTSGSFPSRVTHYESSVVLYC